MGCKKNKNKGKSEVPWGDSEAKKLLWQDIVEGRILINAKDKNNKSTMKLNVIYNMHPEYKEYDYKRFSGCVSSIRKSLKECKGRAKKDQKAFDNYVARHPPSLFSKKGYIEWQDSVAQKQLRKDIREGKHEEMEKQELYELRSVYYENFTLAAFRDKKLYQEIRTQKYLYTLKVRGKNHHKKFILS